MKKIIALFVLLFLLAVSPVHATISTEQSQVILQGNDATTSFSFPFVADSADDIQVSYTPSTGIPEIILPSQYSIFINPPSPGQLWGVGGTVQYPLSGSPIAYGTSLTIQRILPLQQLVTIANQGNFDPEVIEQGIDVLEMQSQQISARTGAFRGVWQTTITYNYGDIVQDGANGSNSQNYYMCILSNESDTWTTDLESGDWTLIIPSVLPAATFPLSIANGGTGAATAPAALANLGAVSLSGSNIYTGSNNFTSATVTVHTRSASDSTTNAASTAFVNGTPLTLTNGTTGITQSLSDNTTKVATTQFVQTAVNGAGSAIKSVRGQQFTASGIYTPSCTTLGYEIVEMSGAGAGSGGTAAGGNVSGSAGAGGYLKILFTGVQVGTSQSITVGAGGTLGAGGSNTSGGNGGVTSFGSLASCGGGQSGGAGNTGIVAGGSGGSCSSSGGTVQINTVGGDGGNGSAIGGNSVGININMPGGSNPLGQGGSGYSNVAGAGDNGHIPKGYGGGASGSSGGGSGAAGTGGVVSITEYCTQ